MQIDKTYSLQDIAYKLKRPRTTLNNWYQTFRIYIPVIGSGRTKRFKEEAIDVFRLIMDLKDNNEPNEVIEQYLRTNTTNEIIIDDQEQENEPVITSIVKSYEKIVYELQDQREIMQQMYIESKETNEQLLRVIQEQAATIDTINENMKSGNANHTEELKEIKAYIQDDIQLREEEKRRVEERDKQLLERFQEITEEKQKKKGSKSWFKKVFKD